MNGRRLFLLLALAAVAVLAAITLTGSDDDPAGPPPTPGESGGRPDADPLAESPRPANEESGSGDSRPPGVAPAPAGDGPASLLVKVVDEAGKPVAGASLRVLEIGKVQTGSFGGAAVDQILMGIEVVDKGVDPPGRTGVTTGDGTCLFEGLMPANYFVGVLSAGRSPGEGSATVPATGRTEVTVEAGPGAVLAGRVVDSRGNPVPGARVLACAWHRMTRLPYASMEMTESGSDGSFRFTSAMPEKRHILCARAPDGRMAISVRIHAPKEDVLLKLNRRITLVGRVYEEGTGIPVAGAKLYAMLGVAESAEDGSYRMEGVAKSLFFRWVMIQKDGYQQKFHEVDFTTSLFGGEETTVDFTLAKIVPGRLFISARDIDGTPLPGVAITVTSAGDEKLRVRGVTDARGDLELLDAPPHGSRLTAAKPGYVQIRRWTGPTGEPRHAVLPERWVNLEPGGDATVDVVLSKAASLRGVVRDQDGKPIEGVSVGDETVTDKEGRFELKGLPRGLRVGVAFGKDGFVPGHQRVEAGGDSEVEVILHRGSSISGRVLDPSHSPVAGASVRLRMEESEFRIHALKTEGGGAFAFGQLAAGRYVLEVEKEGFAMTKSRPIEVPPGAAVKKIDLVVTTGFRAVFRVETAAGGRARADVAIHGPLDRPEAERIDLGGESFDEDPHEFCLPAGKYRIVASPSWNEEDAGAVEETREVTGDGEILITLGSKPRFITARLPARAKAGSLHVRRTDPPIPRFHVWAPQPGGGTVRSQALPPGRYKVVVYYAVDDSNSWVGREFSDVEPGGPALEVRGD